MTGSARATLPGAELARICANAGAFVPARAQTKMLALRIVGDRVETAGTDSYAVGTDSAPANVTTTGQTFPLGVAHALSRDDMADIESAARQRKKELVTLILEPTLIALQWATPEGEPERLEVAPEPYPAQAWQAVETMLNRQRGESRPEFVAFDPALFAHFAKVRAEKDRVMDLWFSSAESPVLVKIGETFRGLVMPLQRAQAERYTADGLW